MSEVPLSDEETKVIFTEQARSNLAALDGTKQSKVINCLLDIVRAEADPSNYIYEQIANIDVLRYSDQGRLYTKVVTHIPEGNSTYHIIYVLYIDSEHDYNDSDLAKFSSRAQGVLDIITDLSSVPDVERYLDNNDALGESDLAELLT